MLKNIQIYFALIAVMQLVSCCKDKNSVSPNLYTNYKMPHEMLDYGYFKPGSYWIYEDTVSGALDSVWVYDAYYQIDTLPEGNSNYLDPGIYDYFQIKTSSSHFNADYYYWCNSSWATEINNYKSLLWREQIIPGTSVIQNITFFYPIIIGNFLYNTNYDTLRITNYLSSYQIQALTYPQVSELKQNKNSTENNSATRFYFSKGFGLIKKEIYLTNQYWQLKRFNVIQ